MNPRARDRPSVAVEGEPDRLTDMNYRQNNQSEAPKGKWSPPTQLFASKGLGIRAGVRDRREMGTKFCLADQAISAYVATITTTDSYNTVAEYRDYVNIALRSQERQAINTWEDRANLDMLRNKEQFIARLHSGRVDELYLNRLGAQDSLQPNEQNPANQQLSDRIAHARNQWEAGYEDRYDQGNYDFTTSASQISDNYTSMLAALDASNLSFQQNLLDIDRYKTYVKNAISGMMTGFATDLAANCVKAEGCAYRGGDNQPNEAGRLLTGMVTRIRAELDKTTVDTIVLNEKPAIFSKNRNKFIGIFKGWQ